MAASPTWSTNQRVSIWDAPPSQIDFCESKHKPEGHRSNSSCADSNGDSVSVLTSHDWGSGSENSDEDEAHDQRSMLDKVAQLITRMLDNDERLDDSSNNNPEEVEDAADSKDGKAIQSSLKIIGLDSSSSFREKFLETKLAQVLIELSAEQENLQFAASAGKELLEQLSDFEDDNYELRSQLHASQQQLVLAEMENSRAQQQQSAMERELMQIHESWTESQPNNSSRGRGEDPPWLSSTAIKEIKPEKCQLCPRRNADLKSVLEENNALKRRCLKLENEQNKQRVGFGELQQKSEALEVKLKRVEAHCDQSEQNVEYTHAQLKQLKLDHQDAAASLDNLRVTARRLQCENDNLVQKLEDRDALATILQNEKRAAGTTAHILENRVSNLQLENQTLMLAIAESYQRQPEAERLQQLHDLDVDDQCNDGAISLQQHARDLENLLDEAQRALIALKIDNKMLRRQRQQRPSENPTPDVTATSRRAKSLTISCADIFTADEAMLQLGDAKVDGTSQKQLISLGLNLEVASDQSATQKSRLAKFEAAAVSPIQVTAAVDLDAALAPPSQGATPTFLQSVATRRRHTYADSNEGKQSIREHERMRRSTVTASAELLEASDDRMAVAKSPLYLGLSVIACATAAAGILSRR